MGAMAGANREHLPLRGALEPELIVLAGHIGLNSTGGVSTSSTYTRLLGMASCTRTGTGAYTLTLQDQYRRIISAHIDLVPEAAGKDLYAEIATIAGQNGVAAGKTITFTTRARSTRAAADNSTGYSTVEFIILASNSGVKG